MIATLQSSSSTAPNGLVNSLAIYGGGDDLYISEIGSGATSDWRTFLYTGFRPAYSGRVGTLEVAFTSGSATNPVVRWNDVDISASFALTTGGTPPNWLDSSLNCTYALSGLGWPAGRAPLGCWINGTLSSADRAFWRLHGRPPAWVQAGGSMVEATTNSDTRTFTGGVGQWVALGAGTVSASGGVGTFSGGPQYYIPNSTLMCGNVVHRVQVEFDLTASGGALSVSSGSSAVDVGSATGHKTAIIDLNVGDGRIYLTLAGFSTASFSIDNFSVKLVGALALPVVQPCLVLDDATPNGQCARLVGMTPVTPRKDFRIVARTATNGNEQLLGGSLFADYTSVRIVDWSFRNNGAAARTISLGSASGGTQYASGINVGTGNVEPVSFSHYLQGNSIWVGSNGTDEIVQLIFGKILSK